MQLLAAIGEKRMTQLLPDRSERDAVDDRAVAGLEAQPQMRLPDLLGKDELMCRQRQHRLGIAAAKRSGAIERGRKLRRHRAR